MTSLKGETLGDIATRLPGATKVFRRHHLDFCCGGAVTLGDAAATAGLDASAIENELAALNPEETPAAPEETGLLIDHILKRYHTVHRQEFTELIRLARKVEAVHREKPTVPAGLADLLETMQSELEEHMQKEETVLFPMMRDGGNPMISYPITSLRQEHEHHGEQLGRIEVLTNHLTPPPEACATWRALYAGLKKLTDDLMEHIHLENNVLFPRFGADSEVMPLAN